jgi:hypothetical protein
MQRIKLLAAAGSLASSAVIVQPASISAPSSDSQSFHQRLVLAESVLRLHGTNLEGPGAAVLKEAVDASRYVMIGEDHLSREIPAFTTGVCRLMAPVGLRALAVEIGPEASKVVNAALRRPDRAARIADFMQAHPDAMAFQNGRDESDMAASCAGLAGKDFQVWGLDQEFFGASGYLIEKMLRANPGPTASAALRNLEALDRAASTDALKSGSVKQLFLFTVTESQMAEARVAVAKDGGTRTSELFSAFDATRTIFLGQYTDGDLSNGRRARLMKTTLADYLRTVPASSRVLFKFGDVHGYRGENPLRQRDLGNYVAERAEGDGAKSLHIAVFGAKGVHALYNGVGRQVRLEPFVMTEEPDYAWIRDAMSTASGRASGRDLLLVDLRVLRGAPAVAVPAEWRQLVRGYDMVVIAPELTPSALLGAKGPQ